MSDSQRVMEGSVVLGRYRIVRPLARGGMGMVYLGRIEGAAGFAKPVVIKRVLSHLDEGSDARAQFVREARILSELQHPGIVGVVDFGEEDGSYLMVLEYVHGYHLGHWLKYVRKTRGLLEWEFAVFAMVRVLRALEHAHQHRGSDGSPKPVIHRDVSPGNILIDLQGNVRLLDFGIARTSEDTDEFKTSDGVLKGKLPYIAPEMYQSRGASVASDVYAAGVVLYQLLTGANPFAKGDMSSIVQRVLDWMPPPVSSVRADVPIGVDDLVLRALAKRPEARFASAGEFADALVALLPRSESIIAAEVQRAVITDFTGELPSLLEVEPLSVLDAAWRSSAAEPNRERSLLHSSLPPAPEGGDTMIQAVVVERPFAHDSFAAPQVSSAARTDALREARTERPSSDGKLGRQRTLVVVLSIALVLAVGAAAAVLLLREPPPPSEPRFLLVEHPDQTKGVPQATATPAAAPAAAEKAPSQPVSVEPPIHAPTAKGAPSAPSTTSAESSARAPVGSVSAADLTRAFAREQHRVQGCFSSNTNMLSGSPELSIRFRISGAGAVESATLAPAALAGTALGQCLVSVARSTQFPARGEPTTFSIPITARVVQQ